MSSAKKIKRLFEHSHVTVGAKVDERIIDDALTILDESKQTESVESKLAIWRPILKNPLVEIAAAAVVIFAFALLFHNGSVNVTSTAFGLDDVIAVLNKAQWMHSRYEIIGTETKPNNIGEENSLSGFWHSVSPSRTIDISTDGTIIFKESSLGKETVYYPKSNTITISYSGIKSKSRYSSIADMVMGDIARQKESGAKVTYTDGFLEGSPVKIVNIDMSEASDRLDSNVTVFVDPVTHLPIRVKHNRILGETVNSNIYLVYEFPQQGPTDIYEAGAPRDAKVEIIYGRDNPRLITTPDNPDLVQALSPYNKARENIISDYILITTYEYDSTVRLLDVVYKQGKKQRSECYSGRKLVFPDSGNEFAEYGFGYLLKWSQEQFNKHVELSQKHKDEHLSVGIYDGKNFSNIEKNLNDNRITEGKRHWPDYHHRFWGLNNLSDWGWPDIPPKNNINQTENEYSRENGLLAFERILEPDVSSGKLICAAKKEIYYLDPNHDCMCVRKEEYQHFIMGGMEIKDVEFDMNEISEELTCVQFVSEFGQTQGGQWYPKKIETHSKSWDDDGRVMPLSLSFITTLYLKTNPVFTEGIFDPARLPIIPITNSTTAGMMTERKINKPFLY